MTTLPWSNLGQNSASRARPVGRGAWLFGVGLTVLSHGGLVGLVIYSHVFPPSSSESERSYIFTNLVSFGRRLEKPWLPPVAPEPQRLPHSATKNLVSNPSETVDRNGASTLRGGKRNRGEKVANFVRRPRIQGELSDEENLAPTMLSLAIAKSQLLTDPEKDRRYRFAIPKELNRAGVRMFALVKICVSRTGDVRSATLVKSMDPSADPLLLAKAKTWKYRPFAIDGRPVPFCYNLRYDVEIQ